MKPLSPELIDRLRAIRERVLREVWLALAAGYRITPGVPTPSAVANPAESLLNPDQSWALRQAFKEGCAVILKNHRHAGIAADSDGVTGSAGLGIGRIDKKQPGDRLAELPGNAGNFHGVADQASRLRSEFAAALIPSQFMHGESNG